MNHLCVVQVLKHVQRDHQITCSVKSKVQASSNPSGDSPFLSTPLHSPLTFLFLSSCDLSTRHLNLLLKIYSERNDEEELQIISLLKIYILTRGQKLKVRSRIPWVLGNSLGRMQCGSCFLGRCEAGWLSHLSVIFCHSGIFRNKWGPWIKGTTIINRIPCSFICLISRE